MAQGFQVQNEVYQAISAEMQAANLQCRQPQSALNCSAQRIPAYWMRDKFNLGFVDVGGWDTHVNQGGADGYPGRLHRANWGVAWRCWSDTLGRAWNDTIVIVVSEFGRTFTLENGDRGTDHGHGSVYWVLGGGVQERQHRRPPNGGDAQANLFQNRDWQVLNDYRNSLIGGVLQRKSHGLTQAQVDADFPFNPAAGTWPWFKASSRAAQSQQQGRRHHHQAGPEEAPEAHLLAFTTPDGRQPQDGGQRAGDRTDWDRDPDPDQGAHR